MKKIIIIADMGHFKVYRVLEVSGESARLELIENYDSIESHGKYSEKLSDKAGNFGESVGSNIAATGYGEPHNIEQEAEKRLIKQIAKSINSVIAAENYAKWCLAAPKAINRQIISNLDPAVKAKIVRNVAADLTKTAKAEILGYFG